MEHKPLVSFVIPYYNASSTIDDTIASIVEQIWPNYDIWIVNDGSKEPGTAEKLSQLAQINSNVTVLHQENAGPGIARNKAIQETKAEFIAPLDADDTIRPDAIQNAISFFENDEALGAVYGHYQRFGEDDKIIRLSEFDSKKQLLFNQIPVTALIRKQVFETCGYYDEFLSKPGLEDWEFWIRVGQSPWKLKNIDSVFFDVRYQHSSRTFQVANKNIDLIKKHIVAKHAQAYFDVLEERNLMVKMLQETPDFRIGKMLLSPYRLLKSLF